MFIGHLHRKGQAAHRCSLRALIHQHHVNVLKEWHLGYIDYKYVERSDFSAVTSERSLHHFDVTMLCSRTQSPKVRSLPCFHPRSSAGPVHPEWLSSSFTYCIILYYRMDWSTKNLHFIIWPSGPTENGCKKTRNDMMEWVLTWKGAYIPLQTGSNFMKKKKKKKVSKYALLFILCDFGLVLSKYFDKVGETAKVLQPIVH